MKQELPYLGTPEFFGQWLGPLTYAFSGVCLLDGGNLTPERIRADIEPFYEAVRMHRAKAWPRLLSKFFLVPVYCSAKFERETIDALSLGSRLGRRNPTRSRFGVYVKPMLYDCLEHEVVFQEALHDWNVGYYALLMELHEQGVAMAEQHFSGNLGREPEV
jgi:hypothetical protein